MKYICKMIGHRYQARYDSRLPENLKSIKRGDPEQIEACRSRTYIFDICTRCGDVIDSKRERAK